MLASQLPVVVVTKRVGFSAAHHYWLQRLDEAENQALYHACSNRFGHGHNYEVDLSVASVVRPETGMVVNLRDLKTWLHAHVVDILDHQHLNHQVPFFTTRVPTLENIAAFIQTAMESPLAKAGLTISHLRVVENSTLAVEWKPFVAAPKEEDAPVPSDTVYLPATVAEVTLVRRYDFAASHRLFNPSFSDADNWAIFGRCNNPNGHGHNYELEVRVRGLPHPETGLLIDLVALDAAVHTHLLQEMDHKHLNFDVAFLQDVIPTAENIVVACWQQLTPAFSAPDGALYQASQGRAQLESLRLLETKENFTEFYGTWRHVR